MQNNDIAEKKRVLADGAEIPGLVFAGEITMEKGTLEVPEFKRIRVIQNGISKIPTFELRYKIKRRTSTLRFFRDWYFKDRIKDVTVIRTDAHGVEFARDLLPQCECVKFSEPEADSATPTYAQISITLLPWDMVPIDAE